MPYKEFYVFFSGKLFYKSNTKLFSCVCIAWYKHSRSWENSRRLCKPSTSSQVCTLDLFCATYPGLVSWLHILVIPKKGFCFRPIGTCRMKVCVIFLSFQLYNGTFSWLRIWGMGFFCGNFSVRRIWGFWFLPQFHPLCNFYCGVISHKPKAIFFSWRVKPRLATKLWRKPLVTNSRWSLKIHV